MVQITWRYVLVWAHRASWSGMGPSPDIQDFMGSGWDDTEPDLGKQGQGGVAWAQAGVAQA